MCFCGGLDETGPYKFIYLNTWSSAGRSVWEGLGSVAVLEEVCQWGWA